MAELLSSEANYHWNISFARPVQDWQLESVASFMDLIYFGSWRRNGVDKICWKPSTRGVFYVCSYYRALKPQTQIFFPQKLLWKPKVPPNVSFFLWIVALGKILTIDNLMMRKVVVVDWCCLCNRNGETTNHLLLPCPIAQELWNMVCTIWSSLGHAVQCYGFFSKLVRQVQQTQI